MTQYKPGDILLDKYRIEKLIGEGAFAEVYLATHIELNVSRALKILRKEAPGVGSTEFKDFQERFRLEARLGAMLDHPNIVRVYDFEQNGDTLVLVMEYCAEGNLTQRIINSIDSGIPVTVEEARQIGIGVAQGLAEIHELDVVHRDLKPNNILFDSMGRPKVADLGLAHTPEERIRRDELGSIEFNHPGTAEYKSPEQRPGHTRGLLPNSDVYALGCVLFEMLTGRIYYNQKLSPSASKYRRDMPEWLNNSVTRMLNEAPDDRLLNGKVCVNLLKHKEEPFPINIILIISITIAAIMGLIIIMFGLCYYLPNCPPITVTKKSKTNTGTYASTPTFTITLTITLTPTKTPKDKSTPTPTFTPSPIPIMIRQTCTHNLYKPIKGCGYSFIREGDAAYVVKGKGIVCLRPEGDTTIYNCYGNADEEDSMLITGGPRCDDNWLWWEAVTDQGIRGWLPEGDNLGDFFIEPFCSEKVCKKSRPSIFRVGDIAILTEWGSNQRIHDTPDVVSPIGVVQRGQTVEILYGPACRNDLVWWKVRVIKTEEEGWIAEGDDKTYWLIPYTGVLEQ